MVFSCIMFVLLKEIMRGIFFLLELDFVVVQRTCNHNFHVR